MIVLIPVEECQPFFAGPAVPTFIGVTLPELRCAGVSTRILCPEVAAVVTTGAIVWAHARLVQCAGFSRKAGARRFGACSHRRRTIFRLSTLAFVAPGMHVMSDVRPATFTHLLLRRRHRVRCRHKVHAQERNRQVKILLHSFRVRRSSDSRSGAFVRVQEGSGSGSIILSAPPVRQPGAQRPGLCSVGPIVERRVGGKFRAVTGRT